MYGGMALTCPLGCCEVFAVVKLHIDGENLRIELGWWRKLLAFHFQALEIPLAHIESVETDRPRTHWMEVRLPGSFVPWLVKAGTYRRAGRRDFWCATLGQPVLRLALRNEYFDSLTFGTEDNERWARAIKGLLDSDIEPEPDGPGETPIQGESIRLSPLTPA